MTKKNIKQRNAEATDYNLQLAKLEAQIRKVSKIIKTFVDQMQREVQYMEII